MKLFIDTAEFKEITTAAETGLVDGVTTNPSLVVKAGVDFEELLHRICEVIHGPISAEVTATDSPGMVREAEKLAKINPKKIVIKIPLTVEGLKATKILNNKNIKTNVTLCFTPIQALLAAKAGATYVSPFIGRLDDIGHDGMKLIADIKTIYKNYGFTTEIIVASVRHVEHVLQAALMGADVSTIPYKIFMQMFQHPLTDSGLERFLKDWEKTKK